MDPGRVPKSVLINQLKERIRQLELESDERPSLSGPLVWVDCEMTGLNPRVDKILEIAVTFLLSVHFVYD